MRGRTSGRSGAILYEMVTGKRAFEGTSAASLIGAIMNAEPPALATLQPLTPPALDHVVRRVPREGAGRRAGHGAHDVADELRWIAAEAARVLAPSETAQAAPPSPAAVLMIVGRVALAARRRAFVGVAPPPLAPPSPLYGSSLDVRPAEELNAGGVRAISHARRLAHGADVDAGRPGARLRRTPGRRAATLRAAARRGRGAPARRTPRARRCRRCRRTASGWRSGREARSGRCRSAAARRRTSCRASATPPGDWSGTPGRPVLRRRATAHLDRSRRGGASAGDDARRAESAPRPAVAACPAGVLLYTVRKRGLVVGRRGGRRADAARPGRANGPAEGRRRCALRADRDTWCSCAGACCSPCRSTPERLEVRGPEVPARRGRAGAERKQRRRRHGRGAVRDRADGNARVGAGPRAAVSGAARWSRWIGAGKCTPLAAPVRSYASTCARLAGRPPAGRGVTDPRRSRLWIYDLGIGARCHHSTGTMERRWPLWSPDGQRVRLRWRRNGRRSLVGGRPRTARHRRKSWRSDALHPVLVDAGRPTGRGGAHAADRITTSSRSADWRRERPPCTAAHSDLTDRGGPEFSPDGRWLAYGSDVSGRFEIYVRPYPGPGPPDRCRVDGGRESGLASERPRAVLRERARPAWPAPA